MRKLLSLMVLLGLVGLTATGCDIKRSRKISANQSVWTNPDITLTEQLTYLKAELNAKRTPEERALIEGAIEELKQSDLVEKSLKVGDQAPDIILNNLNGKTISMHRLLKQGPVVVVFFRGHWCSYCNVHLGALQRELDNIQDAGGQLIAVSPESPGYANLIKERQLLEFDILYDYDNYAAHSFGVVYELSQKLRPLYEQRGILLPMLNGTDSYELPIPATFIVDTHGTICYAHTDPDYRTRLEPKKIVSVLKEMKKRGHLCPRGD